MRVRFERLDVETRHTVESVPFASQVTFIHGPVGTGKSTVARLIDYCLGGDLEATPAMQREFLSARLVMTVGAHTLVLERDRGNASTVRATWESEDQGPESAAVPINPDRDAVSLVFDADVFNLSDLLFYLSGIEPIKVRKRRRDADSPLVRLSIRDLWMYCYLEQDELDSAFYYLRHPFKRNKSIDAMRFVTGLFSDRMNELEKRLATALEAQRTKREAVKQIRAFLDRLEYGTGVEISARLAESNQLLARARQAKETLDRDYREATHAADPIRQELRTIGRRLNDEREALTDLLGRSEDETRLRSELVTAKMRGARAATAKPLLEELSFHQCPQCTQRLPERTGGTCAVCGQEQPEHVAAVLEESARRDLDTRIDELEESIRQRREASERQKRRVEALDAHERELHARLRGIVERYESAFLSQAREVERSIAMLEERAKSLEEAARLPEAVDALEQEAGSLQGEIDVARSALEEEHKRLTRSGDNIEAIEGAFAAALRAISFPGVGEDDRVELGRASWQPEVVSAADDHLHWGFYQAGSGGKKVLFNVCYGVAVHEVASTAKLPLPRVLIIDSPMKNISKHANKELVKKFYQYLYRQCAGPMADTQVILIDSDLVLPRSKKLSFEARLMTKGDPENPPLISYYDGP